MANRLRNIIGPQIIFGLTSLIALRAFADDVPGKYIDLPNREKELRTLDGGNGGSGYRDGGVVGGGRGRLGKNRNETMPTDPGEDFDNPVPPRYDEENPPRALPPRGGTGGGYVGGGGASIRTPYVDDYIEDPDQAAMLAACGLETPPMGEPFRRDRRSNEIILSGAWVWGKPGNPINHYRFSRDAHMDRGYTNPIYELYIMRKLRQQGGVDFQRQRCEVVKSDFLGAYRGMQSSAAGASTSTNVLDSFFADSRGGSDSPGADACAEYGDDEKYSFACSYINYQANLEGGARQKQAAAQLYELCRNLMVDMRPRMNMADYQMQINGGIDAFGGGMCGQRGGPIIISQPESKFTTAVNGLLGAFKLAAPIWAMHSLGKMQQQNAAAAIASNERLGFPSMVTAGGGIGAFGGAGFGYGGGGFGFGGCGGPGAGGCPFGTCGGNCGINAGMNPGFVAGGGVMGGMCGTPPYAPWAGGGCNGMGAGMGSPFYGSGGVAGGMPGMGYPWNGGGLGGLGMGPIAGMGGFGGNGFPGPAGTLGGTNGWGAGMPGMVNGGFGGGVPGMYNGGLGGGAPGMYNGAYPNGMLGNGYNPFPGPAGTVGGTNGWGNPWGSNGMYGQPGFGGNNAFNAQLVQAQAQMYQEYAARIARQAQAQSQAATAYQQSLNTYQEAYQKSYQAYMAYQMASSGYTGAASNTMSGVGSLGLGNYNNGFYNSNYNYSGVPNWYPPYNSGYNNSGRGNWNFNFNTGNIR